MSNTKILLDLKEKIENTKIQKHKLEGQLESLNKILKDDFDCPSLKHANSLLIKVKKEVEQKTIILNKEIEKLENDIT